MTDYIRLKENVLVIPQNESIFVGHLDVKLQFSDTSILSLLRELKLWCNLKDLSVRHKESQNVLYALLSELNRSNLLEKRNKFHLNKEVVISHMNEIGLLISAMLIEEGLQVATLDKRVATFSDVRGQLVQVANVGDRFQDILDAQRREIINSGNKSIGLENEERVRAESARSVLITTYPEPELLAYLMAEGIDHLCVIGTANGVQIGPFVRPGVTPCFHCIELHKSDQDDQWLTVAATLFSKRLLRISMQHALLGATLGAKFVMGEFAHHIDAQTTMIYFNQNPVSDYWGFREERHTWSFHPKCSCHWSRALSTRAK